MGTLRSVAPTSMRDRLEAVRGEDRSDPLGPVLSRATELYRGRPLAARDLRGAASRLEAILRAERAELTVERAPRPTSPSPRRAAIAVHLPLVAGDRRKPAVLLESHSVVMRPDGALCIRAVLPGWTGAHMLQRVAERHQGGPSVASVALGMSRLWPLLLFMRNLQLGRARGRPLNAIVTPYGDGLLFASLEKVGGLPPIGVTVTEVDAGGGRERPLRDWFARDGERVWVGTRTFVDAELLSAPQRELRDRLAAFRDGYADVAADAAWRWRIGLGQRDAAVDAVAEAFRLRPLAPGRAEEAMAALETVVASDLWETEAARNAASQERSRRRRA